MFTTTPATIAATALGADLVIDGQMLYFLTPCCKASVKGAQDGVVCRSCYRPVDERLGMAWNASDQAGWDWYADQIRGDLQHFTDRSVARSRQRAMELAAGSECHECGDTLAWCPNTPAYHDFR